MNFLYTPIFAAVIRSSQIVDFPIFLAYIPLNLAHLISILRKRLLKAIRRNGHVFRVHISHKIYFLEVVSEDILHPLKHLAIDMVENYTSIPNDDCDFSTQLHESVLLQCIRWIHVFVLLSATVLVIYTGLRLLSLTIFDRMTLWYLQALLMMISVYSVGFGTTQSAHIIAREIAPTPCDAQIPKPFCLFRMSAAAVVPAFVLIHAAITLHQTLATFGCSLRVQKAAAVLTISFTICYVILFGVFSFYEESLSGNTQLCPFFNEKGEVFIIINLNAMMAVDVVNFISARILLRYNRRLLAKERIDYKLKRTFRRVQNLKAMEQFIPMHALHSITHLVHFCLYSITYYFRPNYESSAQFIIIFAVVNVIPYYCFLSPFAFLILTKLGRFRRQDEVRNMIVLKNNQNAQEAYFKELRAAWN